MTAKIYTFESANMGDIEIEITGEYTDGGKDVEALISDRRKNRRRA